MQFNRSMKGFEECQITHVADEDRSAWTRDCQDLGDYFNEIINVREILRNRVENDGVE